MDDALLRAPLVPPTPALMATAPVTEAEARRLLALPPSEYWLEMARQLDWFTPPDVGLEGQFGATPCAGLLAGVHPRWYPQLTANHVTTMHMQEAAHSYHILPIKARRERRCLTARGTAGGVYAAMGYHAECRRWMWPHATSRRP